MKQIIVKIMKLNVMENKTIKTIATGFSIQHNEDWVDPRREQNENYCE